MSERKNGLYARFGDGGRGSPLYGLYRHVQPQRVGFFSRFVHKEGIDFGHFCLKDGMVLALKS